MTERVVFWSMAYGDWYIDYLERCSLRSIMQPGNIPRLLADGCEVTYRIDTTAQEHDRLQDLLERTLPSDVRLIVTTGLVGQVLGESNGAREMIRHCIQKDARCIPALPDVFFGNNTAYNMLAYVAGRDFSLGVAPPRVHERPFMEAIQRYGTISNPQLVDIIFETMHGSLRKQWTDVCPSSTYAGGASIRAIGPSLWSMIYNTTSPYCVKFLPADERYFASNLFGHWDWAWPTQLVESGRWRVCGSSDLACLAEPTRDEVSWEAETDYGLGSEAFHSDMPHFKVNGSVVQVMRGTQG